MSTINQELLRLLQEELRTGKTQVYAHVKRKRKVTGLQRAQAAVALGLELGIDVSRYATAPDLEEIGKAEPGLQSLINAMMPTQRKVADAILESQKREGYRDPFLDSKLVTAAFRNGEICSKLFLFENSLRRVVYAVMAEEFGMDWWYDVTPRDIMYSTFDRRSGEKGPRWRGQFGAEPIYYTNVQDLSVIINKHQESFSKLLGRKLSIDKWVPVIERIRAALTFTNPITQKELDKFLTILKQWDKIALQIRKKLKSA